MTTDYLLVTPAKNEEKNLPSLISSILSQEKQPKLWVIVDDGSTDKSQEIIERSSREHKWIITVRLDESRRDIGFHYSEVCRTGFNTIITKAREMGISFGFIALLDADIIIKEHYFLELINRMEKDASIGITSGAIWSKEQGKYVKVKQRTDLPSGAARIWKIKCYEETNGFEKTMAPDSVSNARAKIKGWKTVRYSDIKAYQSRATASAEGLWIGYKRKGQASYYLHEPFYFILGKASSFAAEESLRQGVAFLWGWLSSWIHRRSKIPDPELKKYFRSKLYTTRGERF
ncbi:MAG: hypothetical protein AYK23_05590 [Candidatus Proteinoplasmatales archaeon SG8-5]|nr:MAG: hypothetical protein AYK23_05590 [Candidatus Proteinoplasmatales archaeon SG8-5]